MNVLRTMATAFLVVAALAGRAWPQDTATAAAVQATSALRVFIDLDGDDLDYYQTQLGFVTFVRDRADADVQIVVSQQRTASGGTRYTMEFRGQAKYASLADTLECSVGPGATDDEERRIRLRSMKFGLMRFVARTPQADGISISYDVPVVPATRIDKWNHWVFSLSANGWLQGQKGYRQTSLYSSLAANRTTKDRKAYLSAWSQYNGVTWDNGDGESSSISRGKGVNGYLVYGLTDHWSARVASSTWSSTYGNIGSAVDGSLAVEYNIFAYQQSTRRQLRVMYRLEGEYDDYLERTIFDKLTQWTAQERLSVALRLVEPWGSVTNTFGLSNYMHSFPLNRLDWNTNVSLSLVKGWKLTANGYVARIHDQLALRAGDVPDSDVILRRREMATSYEYYLSVGFELSFGSIYSNEVNARFGN